MKPTAVTADWSSDASIIFEKAMDDFAERLEAEAESLSLADGRTYVTSDDVNKAYDHLGKYEANP